MKPRGFYDSLLTQAHVAESAILTAVGGRCHRRSIVGSLERTLERVQRGQSDANIRFDDLRALLLALGFAERTRGSHHIFSAVMADELVNLQRDGDKAKPYQVRQVRRVILKYNLRLKA